MLKNRVIPSLLLSNKQLVKTIKFKNKNYIGDPINAIKIFNEKEVDELMILDIDKSANNSIPDYKYIEKLCGECFMPLCYGGGISTIEHASIIFKLGIEKICIQSEALKNPMFISELSNKFGSSSIVLSVDVKKNIFNNYKVYDSTAKKSLNIDFVNLLIQYQKFGAGEILLNSVDKDGTLSGPDLNLINQAANIITIPLIAQGGISSLEDIKNTIDAGASAIAVGSYFIYHGPYKAVLITYPNYKELQNLFPSYD